jgi:hypothetical protein
MLVREVTRALEDIAAIIARLSTVSTHETDLAD